MSLAGAYGLAFATPSDISEHVPTLANLGMESQTIIELGVRSGVSTTAFLFGLSESGGSLWSVDIDGPPELDFKPVRWEFLRGDDISPEVYAKLPDDVDVIFIDTSHSHAHTRAELNLYKWKVRAGGLIVLHDTELQRPLDVGRGPAYPVRTAVEEFCAEEGYRWENRPNCFGLGLITIGGDV